MVAPWELSSGWIVEFKRVAQARIRLFCFPYGGGSASIFRTWSDNLPSGVELCGIQLPGHGTRLGEEPLRDFRSLINILTRVLRPHLTIPFAFFGHSLGAAICFEVARDLRDKGWGSPIHLFASAQTPPHLANPAPAIHDLPDEKFIGEVCRRYQGIPLAILQETELMRLLLPALRADFALMNSYGYRKGQPLDCPVTVFGGLDDGSVRKTDLGAWAEQTCKTFELKMFPGGHLFLDSARPLLLQAVSETLERYLKGEKMPCTVADRH